MAPEFKNGRF